MMIACSSYAGLTRVSITLHTKVFFRRRWMAGSSPAMTIWVFAAHAAFLRYAARLIVIRAALNSM
jgi:hypothetical protein